MPTPKHKAIFYTVFEKNNSDRPYGDEDKIEYNELCKAELVILSKLDSVRQSEQTFRSKG